MSFQAAKWQTFHQITLSVTRLSKRKNLSIQFMQTYVSFFFVISHTSIQTKQFTVFAIIYDATALNCEMSYALSMTKCIEMRFSYYTQSQNVLRVRDKERERNEYGMKSIQNKRNIVRIKLNQLCVWMRVSLMCIG